MSGTLALVGAGEFLPSMDACDRVLIERAGGGRVAVLPTASAPDGAGVPQRWAEQGVAHFRRLGAEALAVMALTPDDCADARHVEAVATCTCVYFSGGKPDYLARTLTGSPLWEAVLSIWLGGGVIAGCSAGAMVMGGYVPDFGARRRFVGWKGWLPGLGLLPNWVIMPHFNEFPELLVRLVMRPPEGTQGVLGIDRDTALIQDGAEWRVCGKGRVSLLRGTRTQRFQDEARVAIG